MMFRSCTGGASSSTSPPPSGSLVSSTPAFEQVNSSLYALYKPPSDPPSVQIVLFHGLQPGDYSDAHLRNWQSEDGSCIWPQTWLVDTFPRAHIFSVSYNGGVANTSHGNSDMYIITENVLSDLLQANIGQDDYCPVILVGHCIGGLVIKQLCNRAHALLHNKPGQVTAKVKTFLNNISGVFYYATPHRGISIPKKWKKELPRLLLTYFKALSKETARLNHEFDNLERVRNKWLLAGLGEGRSTNLGRTRNFVVPEASTRAEDYNVAEGADHFSICKPRDKLSRSFQKLEDFARNIVSRAQDAKMFEDMRLQEIQDAKMLEDMRLQEEARAFANRRPENFQHVPKNVTGVDDQVKEIIGKLKNMRQLGLVGMGGSGKSTLAKEVFNRLAPNFEYTCFIPNVKLIEGDQMNVEAKMMGYMHRSGKKIEKGNEEWRSKPLLLVLDDLSGERDENFLSEIEGTTAPESRIIFTSRNKHPLSYSGEVHEVTLLQNTSAGKLFRSCAFPNGKIPLTEFERIINAIVEKCDGLPLALAALGNFLRTKEKYEEWEQTVVALEKAQKDLPDINDRLWANLQVSYNGLDKNLQQIFLDVTTFFSSKRWTLQEAMATWEVVYDTPIVSLLWRKLVDLSLVYDVKEDEPIHVHEQLQSLGRKIASETINEGNSRVWDGDEGWKLLQNMSELRKQQIFALRLDGPRRPATGNRIARVAFPLLKKLRYLEVNAENLVLVDEAQRCLPFQAPLSLLDCDSEDLSRVLLHPELRAHIVILRVSWGESSLPTYIGSFSKLKFLTLHAEQLETLPHGLENLSQLQYLNFHFCRSLKTLPEPFGSLSALSHLEFNRCEQLQTLPESFGSLSALSYLDFRWCGQLQTLPESFGSLSALSHLGIYYSGQLQTLPESFGSLSALSHLEFSDCEQLQTLPESFGSLSALSHLKFSFCDQLQTLPESFGSLSTLSHLEFFRCDLLQTLPESFGSLSALSYLEIYICDHLQTLPESFGSLSALRHLKFSFCEQLQTLPESFGSLSALSHLEFLDCEKLQTLPKSFGSLSALSHLEFKRCEQLQTLPESFGSLSALSYLDFRWCGQLQTLPESFGSLSALSYLDIYNCDQLQTLPESFGSLSALSHLEFRYCDQFQTLPESFGSLSALSHLQINGCEQLQTLPESFGSLSALSHLKFSFCEQLQTLPESFGSLSALSHLEIYGCEQLQTLPESFGSLSALSHLEIYGCEQLQTLPESFGSLSTLSHLKFSFCEQLQTLPESFGSLSALSHLEIYGCEQLQTLPESFGSLSTLSHLKFSFCEQLQTLPESFGSLSALSHLEFRYCGQLQTLPKSFGSLFAVSHLKFVSCPKLLTLPNSFTQLSTLKYLEFTNCVNLRALPRFLHGVLPINPANVVFREERP